MALLGKQIGIKRVRDRDTLLWELYGYLEKSALLHEKPSQGQKSSKYKLNIIVFVSADYLFLKVV
jgi:hypothetical protein